MSDISNRLNLIKDYYNIKSYAEFAKYTGLSHQNASNYLKGKQNPDIEKLAIIVKAFDEINTNWLITGNGNMFLKPNLNDIPIGEIIKYLYKFPKEQLEKNETWNMFIELQFKSKHIEDVKKEIQKLKILKSKQVKNL